MQMLLPGRDVGPSWKLQANECSEFNFLNKVGKRRRLLLFSEALHKLCVNAHLIWSRYLAVMSTVQLQSLIRMISVELKKYCPWTPAMFLPFSDSDNKYYGNLLINQSFHFWYQHLDRNCVRVSSFITIWPFSCLKAPENCTNPLTVT